MVDLTNFPFDVQTYRLKFMHAVHFSRGYGPAGLRFELLASNVTRDHFTDGGEWELTSGAVYNGSKTTPPPFTLTFHEVYIEFVTARIRRMTGGYIFSLSTLAGEGYPISGLGRGGRGYPISGLGKGGTPSQVWVGRYPIPGLGRGYPIPGLGEYPISGGGVPHSRSGGYPILVLGGTPSQFWGVLCPRSGGVQCHRYGGCPISDGGVPHPRSGGYSITVQRGVPRYPPDHVWMGYPPSPNQVWIRQSSIASTCYMAGSVPLAFTQEDFLVLRKRSNFYVLNLIVRGTFVSILSVLVFLLPTESGEKISLQTTVFLS